MTVLEQRLLVRRWPERRAVVLGVALAAFIAVVAGARSAGDPAHAIGVLNVLPVMLVALELGWRGGLVAALAALAAALSGEPVAVLTQSVAFVAVGLVAGRFSDRLRAAHQRDGRLLGSGLAITKAASDALPGVVAEAALRTPGATGAVVELQGRAPARVGRTNRTLTRAPIVARGVELGRVTLAHRHRLAPEDVAALQLLALQAGLAADNQRLLQQEHEAAALERELRRVRDELLAERSELGRLLEAEEEDRRRVAERLHEELAQVLAAVLLGLRLLRRGSPGDDAVPLDELHDQLVGVLADMRDMAAALRPSALDLLGLRAALAALAEESDVALEVGDMPSDLPDPLRTGVYRIVEQVVAARPQGDRLRVAVHERDGRLEIVLAPGSGEEVQARVALLGGAIEPRDDGAAVIGVPLPA